MTIMNGDFFEEDEPMERVRALVDADVPWGVTTQGPTVGGGQVLPSSTFVQFVPRRSDRPVGDPRASAPAGEFALAGNL